MFDADDPLLARLRAICMEVPDAAEKISHGRVVWFTTKVFAVYGGKVKGDHADPLLDRALLFLPDPAERLALNQDERFHVPAYYGPAGWLALPLDVGRARGQAAAEVDPADVAPSDAAPVGVDWGEVSELVDSSYRQTAGVRRVARLDAATGAARSR